MSLSQRHIDTLVELLDIELKVLDAFPDENAEGGRIPQLESCRRELFTLAAIDRARRKKAFPGLSWKRHRPDITSSRPGAVEIPATPVKPKMVSRGGVLDGNSD